MSSKLYQEVVQLTAPAKPVVKKSSASAAVKPKESKPKRVMPELLSEQADLQFLELVKERMQMGREVQYALQEENEELRLGSTRFNR